MVTSKRWLERKDALQQAVKESISVSEVAKKLGLSPKGGNIKTVKNYIEYFGFDASHFLGQGHGKGNVNLSQVVIPLEEILVEGSSYTNTWRLKRKIIEAGLLEEKCALCGQEAYWNGKKLVMVIDHINGINNDHRIENLRLLCPNCNSQQSTFCGRNIQGKHKVCKGCGGKVSYQSKTGYCKKCIAKHKKDCAGVVERNTHDT